MQLNKFKFLKEDNESYHVQHPKGRTLQILKGGLSDQGHEQIKKLKGYKDGGKIEVEKEPIVVDLSGDRAPASEDLNAPHASQEVAAEKKAGQEQLDAEAAFDKEMQPDLAAQKAYINEKALQQTSGKEAIQPTNGIPNIPGGAPAPEAPINPQISNQTPAAPIAPQPAAPGAPPSPVANLQDAYNQQENAIRAGAKAEADLGAKQATAYGEYQNQLSKLQTPQQINDAYKAKDDALAKAYENQTIDPNRFWNNQSTGSKIGAGIGILLSGIGSGITGKENMAMENINKAIANDIDSQKNQQGKTKTLWEMNQKALGNDMAANLATQNQLLTGVQAKLQIAAAQAMGPLAQAKAQQAIADVEKQKMQNRAQLSAIQYATQGGGDPASLVKILVPESQQKEVAKEIGDAQNLQKNKEVLMGLFEKGKSENSILGRAGRFGFEPPSYKEFKALTDPIFRDKDGRYNETEASHVYGLFPQPGNKESTDAANQKAFVSWLDNKSSAPLAKTHGIDLSKFQSTAGPGITPQQKSYLDWAKANPSDPRAKLVMQKLGGS